VDEIRAAEKPTRPAWFCPRHGRQPARNVILGGADSIEHGFYLRRAPPALKRAPGWWARNFQAHPSKMDRRNNDRPRKPPRKSTGSSGPKIGVKWRLAPTAYQPAGQKPGRNDAGISGHVMRRCACRPRQLKAMTTDAAEFMRSQDPGRSPKGWRPTSSPHRPTLENIQALRQVLAMKDGKVARTEIPVLYLSAKMSGRPGATPVTLAAHLLASRLVW
jgi:hypothetical protein